MTEPLYSLDDLLRQEETLVFARFGSEEAIALGMRLVDTARADGHALAIDVMRCGQQLFHAALPGTSVDNDRWIERKRAVVERFGRPSLTMRRLCEREGTTLEARFQLEPLRFAAHGGAFPITVRGAGVVGSVTVSGLPHETDHRLVVEALQAMPGLVGEG